MSCGTSSQRCFKEHDNLNSMENINSPKHTNKRVVTMANECNGNLTRVEKTKSAFNDFCRSTSLHGWHHLIETHQHRGVYMWIFIVVASIGVASFFLFTSVDDFTSKYVVTNIDTTTAPLDVSLKKFVTVHHGTD
jgi:hypothetical protein